jgi:hypothetical protein
LENSGPELEDTGPQSQVTIKEIELPGEPLGEIAPVRQPHPPTPLMRVAQQRVEFSRALEQQFAATINEQLLSRSDTGAFHIAEHEVRQMATALGMDADQIAVKFRARLFTLEIPDASTIPDLHWREVHAIHPDWRYFTRIGVGYASAATSEIDVERILGEQQELQGAYGINYGADTLHVRLVP